MTQLKRESVNLKIGQQKSLKLKQKERGKKSVTNKTLEQRSKSCGTVSNNLHSIMCRSKFQHDFYIDLHRADPKSHMNEQRARVTKIMFFEKEQGRGIHGTRYQDFFKP